MRKNLNPFAREVFASPARKRARVIHIIDLHAAVDNRPMRSGPPERSHIGRRRG